MVLLMLFNGGMAWLRKTKKVDGAEPDKDSYQLAAGGGVEVNMSRWDL